MNKKYDVEIKYVLPELPESLGLEKKEYKMPTEEELMSLAEQTYRDDYLADVNSAQEKSKQKQLDFEQDIETQKEKAEQGKKSVFQSLVDDVEKILNRANEQGILRSSIVKNVVSDKENEVEDKAKDIEIESQTKIDQLLQQIENVKQQAEQTLESLKQKNQEKVATKYQSLIENAQKEKNKVDEYNNTVAQKEQEYLVQKALAEEELAKSETERAKNVAEIYAKLGRTGVEEVKMEEKIQIAKDFLDSLDKNDALRVLTKTDVFREQFDEYYEMLVNYVKNK